MKRVSTIDYRRARRYHDPALREPTCGECYWAEAGSGRAWCTRWQQLKGHSPFEISLRARCKHHTPEDQEVY